MSRAHTKEMISFAKPFTFQTPSITPDAKSPFVGPLPQPLPRINPLSFSCARLAAAVENAGRQNECRRRLAMSRHLGPTTLAPRLQFDCNFYDSNLERLTPRRVPAHKMIRLQSDDETMKK